MRRHFELQRVSVPCGAQHLVDTVLVFPALLSWPECELLGSSPDTCCNRIVAQEAEMHCLKFLLQMQLYGIIDERLPIVEWVIDVRRRAVR